MSPLANPVQAIRRYLRLVGGGAILVFIGWLAGAFSITVATGGGTYLIAGPFLVLVGLIGIAVGILLISQSLSFLPEVDVQEPATQTATSTLDRV